MKLVYTMIMKLFYCINDLPASTKKQDHIIQAMFMILRERMIKKKPLLI